MSLPNGPADRAVTISVLVPASSSIVTEAASAPLAMRITKHSEPPLSKNSFTSRARSLFAYSVEKARSAAIDRRAVGQYFFFDKTACQQVIQGLLHFRPCSLVALARQPPIDNAVDGVSRGGVVAQIVQNLVGQVIWPIHSEASQGGI